MGDERARQPDARLGAALALSVALHVAVLTTWTPAVAPARVGQHPVLTARLLGVRSFLETPAPAPARTDTTSVAAATPSPSRHATQAPPQAGPAEPPAARTDSASPPGLAATATRPALPPGSVRVLLAIDENGNVRQIIWGQLFYMTNETLNRLEQQLRQKVYRATGRAYTVHEVVEVIPGHP